MTDIHATEGANHHDHWYGVCKRCKLTYRWPKGGALKSADASQNPSCPRCAWPLRLTNGNDSRPKTAVSRSAVGLDPNAVTHLSLPNFGRHTIKQITSEHSGAATCSRCLARLTSEEVEAIKQATNPPST